MITDEWKSCYKRGWGRELVPDAFSHPAKVSFSLSERIYQHMIAEGWLHPGDSVIDPFAGICGFGYHALKHGLHFVGVELEQKFVDLSAQNIALWNKRYAGRFARWGTARVLQGDSRRLLEIVGAGTAGVVSSPPFSDSLDTGKRDWIAEQMRSGKMRTTASGDGIGKSSLSGTLEDYGSTFGNLGNLRATDEGFDAAVSSPPYNPPMSQDHSGSRGGERGHTPSEPGAFARYGNTLGQLEGMSMDGFDAAVSSPPYATGAQHTGGDDPHPEHIEGGELRYVDYGHSAGQLAAMRAGGFDGAVSSPPWMESQPSSESDSLEHGAKGKIYRSTKGLRTRGGDRLSDNAQWGREILNQSLNLGSINTHGNNGRMIDDNFWSSARVIVEQTFAALRPGGHAVWVVKSFVRNGALVDFPDQWRQLCESVGFVTLHEHRASLVRDDGTQLAMDGNHKRHRVKRVSFFRRLHEQKRPDLAIDFETVYCMVKEA